MCRRLRLFAGESTVARRLVCSFRARALFPRFCGRTLPSHPTGPGIDEKILYWTFNSTQAWDYRRAKRISAFLSRDSIASPRSAA